MTTYFVAGEIDSVVVLAPTGVYESANAGQDGGFNRGGIRCTPDMGANAQGFAAYLINSATGQRTPATGTVWTHFQAWLNNSNNSNWTQMIWRNHAGIAVFRLQMNGYCVWQPQIWDGTSTWVNVGNSFNFPATNFDNKFDFQMVIGSSGLFRCIINGTEMSNVSLDTSVMVDIARIDFGTNGGDTYWGSIIVADYSTIAHTVRRRSPQGNGTNNAWVGNWDGVDEFQNNGLPNDSDGVSVNAVGAKETFTAYTLSPSPAGSVIKAVAVAVRARTDAAAVPKHVKALIRIGSTDYESPNMDGTGADTYGGAIAIWENDPSTGQSWGTIDNVNGEIGVKSDT